MPPNELLESLQRKHDMLKMQLQEAKDTQAALEKQLADEIHEKQRVARIQEELDDYRAELRAKEAALAVAVDERDELRAKYDDLLARVDDEAEARKTLAETQTQLATTLAQLQKRDTELAELREQQAAHEKHRKEVIQGAIQTLLNWNDNDTGGLLPIKPEEVLVKSESPSSDASIAPNTRQSLKREREKEEPDVAEEAARQRLRLQ
ncbi:hypothetical protein C8F01DRAFT_1265819 [Mycena amicta]|nr:hypothetical protein C8F01DRAFT_1265819 [Mycena amicta]